MAKFYKQGRVVVVTNGKFAGKKGIIVRSNFEQTKTKKYPHCLVLGLSKYPRRVTKKYLKRMQDKTQSLEAKLKEGKVSQDTLEKLKRFGIFVKTYNMNHILATRYKVTENFGIDAHMKTMENLEEQIKEAQTKLNALQAQKFEKEQDKKDQEAKLQNLIGDNKSKLKNALTECKVKVGGELYNRFMRGFIKVKENNVENEKIEASEFLFNKLKF